jgi:hypothetical protein
MAVVLSSVQNGTVSILALAQTAVQKKIHY